MCLVVALWLSAQWMMCMHRLLAIFQFPDHTTILFFFFNLFFDRPLQLFMMFRFELFLTVKLINCITFEHGVIYDSSYIHIHVCTRTCGLIPQLMLARSC